VNEPSLGAFAPADSLKLSVGEPCARPVSEVESARGALRRVVVGVGAHRHARRGRRAAGRQSQAAERALELVHRDRQAKVRVRNGAEGDVEANPGGVAARPHRDLARSAELRPEDDEREAGEVARLGWGDEVELHRE